MMTDNNESSTIRSERKRQLRTAFCTQRHSLRLSASNIAAVTGYHPWKDLTELLQDLVYQGKLGRELLLEDTHLLGLQLVGHDERLQQLAHQAGVTSAMAEVWKVKDGQTVLPTIQAAHAVKQKILQTVKTKLPKRDFKLFQEGVRAAIDTGYGTSHENTALDLYEQQTGWPVTERNAEILQWPVGVVGTNTVAPMTDAFPISSNGMATLGNNQLNASTQHSGVVVVVDLTNEDNDVTEFNHNNKTTKQDQKPFFSILGSIDGMRDELAPGCDQDDDSWVIRKVIVECKHRMSKLQPQAPLYEQIQTSCYCLMYKVDHADLVQVLRLQKKEKGSSHKINNNKKSKSDSSSTKDHVTLDHWLNGDVDNKEVVGDAVSIEIRNNGFNESKPTTNESSPDMKRIEKGTGCDVCVSNDVEALPASIISDAKLPIPSTDKRNAFDNNNKNSQQCESYDSMIREDSNNTKIQSNITIRISRVSLDDPIWQHRQQWNTEILPRLRSFVDAVYNIRGDDNKRYRFLTARSDISSTAEAWQILFDECTWLKFCDTAYLRMIDLAEIE